MSASLFGAGSEGLVGEVDGFHGEADAEGGSLAELGVEFELAVVFFDDLLGDGQTEAGAALALGGEEGDEELFLVFFGDADAVVLDFDDGILFDGVEEGGERHHAALRLDRINGVDEEVENRLVDTIGIDGDGRLSGADLGEKLDFFVGGGAFHEVEAFVEDMRDVGHFEGGLAFLGVGKHVHGEGLDFVEVALEHFPASLDLVDVGFAEAHFDDVGAAGDALEDVLDGVGKGCDGFAGGGETFLLDRFLVEPGVFDGHAGELSDGGEEAELVLGVGEVGDQGVDVDDAEDFFPAADGDADGGADGEVVDGLAFHEALIGHGIGGEDAFFFGDDVLDDGLGDGDFSDLVLVTEADDAGVDAVGVLLVDEGDEATVGAELFEGEVHDAVEDLVDVEESGESSGDLKQDAEVGHGGGGGLWGGEDDGVIGGGDGGDDGGVAGLGDVFDIDVGAGGDRDGLVGRAEDQERGAHADLVADFDLASAVDADAVDEDAVGGAVVEEEPAVAGVFEVGVAAGDGQVGEGNELAGSAESDVVFVGEIEAATFVRTL